MNDGQRKENFLKIGWPLFYFLIIPYGMSYVWFE